MCAIMQHCTGQMQTLNDGIEHVCSTHSASIYMPRTPPPPLMIQAVRNNSSAIIKLVLHVGGNRVRLLAMHLNGAINKVKSPFKVKTADTVHRLT